MHHMPEVQDAQVILTKDDAVKMLAKILNATPGMPDAAWQQFNVGVMRILLEHVEAAPEKLNGTHVQMMNENDLNEARAGRADACRVIDEISAIMEPGITPVAERCGQVRAVIRAFARGSAPQEPEDANQTHR